MEIPSLETDKQCKDDQQGRENISDGDAVNENLLRESCSQ